VNLASFSVRFCVRVILGNDASDGCAGYRRCVTTDRPAERAGVPASRWFPAGVAENRWLGIVVVAAAVAVVLTVAAEPWDLQRGRLLIPLLACVLVVVLRRWPLPLLGVVTVAAATVTAWGSASLPFGVLLGLALYFSALGLPRPESIVLALGVAVALGVALVYTVSAVGTAQAASEATAMLVPLAGAWFIADSVAARRRYQAGLAAQAERERAAEVRQERVRIAREMHDVVAHALAVITVQAGVGRCLAANRPTEASAAAEGPGKLSAAAEGPGKLSAAFGSIETIGRTAQDELRIMLGLLRDGEAETAPLAPVPTLIDVKDLADTVRASGVAVELRMEGTDRRLSPSLALSVYRVVQEALTNVVKHAPGARAAVELTVSAGKIRLDVRDDGGPGGQAQRAGLSACHGITGMRERIGAFGGWLVAGPVAGGGFQVTAEVPVEGAAS
jgi:signal transduction histidine kinase